jgi:hypothetical protein
MKQSEGKTVTIVAMKRLWILGVFLLVGLHAAPAMAAAPSLEVNMIARLEGSVPVGAQRVPMLRLQMRTSCITGVNLSTIVLHHVGHGAVTDIERVYGYVDGARVTRASIFRRDGSVTLYFRNFDIPQCTSKTVDVVADFAADASPAGEHAITLSQASDVAADPPARVTLKSAAGAGLVRPTGRTIGSVSIQFLDLLQNPRYGDGQVVARFLLKGGERDQEVKAITFTNDGSARDGDLGDLAITTTTGTRLTEQAAQLAGDKVRLEFLEPFVIGRNQTRMLQLRADVRASSRRTLRIHVEEPSDVEAAPARYRGI